MTPDNQALKRHSRHAIRSRVVTASRAGLAPMLVVGVSIVLGGCASSGGRAAGGDLARGGVPSDARLQQVAQSAISGGNVQVRTVDGIVYLSGKVENSIDESAAVRALRRVEGVEQVESVLRREM